MDSSGDVQETEGVIGERFGALLAEARRALSATPATALTLAERCIPLARSAGRPRDEVSAWRLQGQALRALGRHQQAIEAFASAANAARTVDDSLLAAQVQLGAIDSLTMLGRSKEAAALAAELIRRFTEEESPLDAAKALCNLGSLYLRQDRYADALNCYTEADAAFEQSEESAGTGSMAPMRALVSVNRAIALTHLNDVEAALQLYEAALRTYTNLEMEGEAAIVETNIAFLRHVSGWHAAALAHLNRAHAVFLAHGKSHEVARCDTDRGEAYRSLNLFPEALECYERAIATFETLPLEYDHARAELGKAATLFALSRVDDSLKSLDHAETVFRKLRNLSQEAHVRLIRAGWLHASDRKEEARPLAVQAALAFARRRLFGWAAEARLLVAAIDEAQGRDATRRLRSVSRTARQTKRGWLECRAEQALGRAAQRRGDVARALRHYRQGIAVLESVRTLVAPDEVHVAYLSDKMGIYSEAVALLLDQGQPKDIEEALEYAERSRSRLLLDRLANSQERLPNPADAEGNLAMLRGALSRAQQGGTSPDGTDPRRFLASPPDQIARLEQAYTEALRAIQLDDAVLPKNGRLRELVAIQEPVRLPSLQASLPEDEVLVSFYRLPRAFVAFLITPQGVRVVPLQASPDDIARVSRRLGYHLQKMQFDPAVKQDMRLLREALCAETDGVLKQLYRYIFAPLEANLIEGARLTILPFGELHGLPFHAFHDGGGYVTDRWEISYAPSASIWYHLNAQNKERLKAGGQAAPRAVLVSVPGPGIERVVSEVEMLESVVPGARIFVGEDAVAEQVISAAQSASILHIAAHAQFRKDNPHFSAVLLTDGWLLARDVYEMNLPFSLVTLSACETALSQVQSGDELFGLIRAFLSAGARAVVGSFWPADDEATAEVMTRFYKNRERGLSDSSALRLAQNDVRQLFPHPYHWAAFGLVGISDRSSKVYCDIQHE